MILLTQVFCIAQDRTISTSKSDNADRVEVLIAEFRQRKAAGDSPLEQELLRAHPELRQQLQAALQQLRLIERAREQAEQAADVTDVRLVSESSDATHPHLSNAASLRIRCPHCQNAIELLVDTPFTDITCQVCFSTFSITGGDAAAGTALPLQTVGHFELISRVGVGGFGTLWQAHDVELDRMVAVKIPRRGQLDTAQAEQFLREARIAAQLKHANIVSVYEVGREGAMLYIVSDFIRGKSLSDWLTEAKPTFSETAKLFVKIADALDHAHNHGVVHRDMKPSNIMMDEAGEPHITDFGLAKRELGEITMTLDGQVLGTPAYMSPEQARGEGHHADRRSDIYSLGVMLFQQLCGELPFRGNAQMQMQQIIIDDVPSPRRFNSYIPRDLETICLKCLEKHPDNRFSTAKRVADELRRYSDGVPIRSRAISPTTRVLRWCRRKPAVASTIALAMLIAVVSPVVAIRERMLRTALAQSNRQAVSSNKELVEEKSFLEPQREQLVAAWQEQLANLSEEEPIDSGLFREARDQYQRQIEQFSLPETDVESRAYLQTGLALLTKLKGDRLEAITQFQAAQHLLEDLVAKHPSTARYQAALADVCHDLARLQREQGDVEQAERNINQAGALWNGLMASRPQDIEYRKRILDSQVELARVQSAANDPQAALNTLTSAHEWVAQLNRQWPRNPRELYLAACALAGSRPALVEIGPLIEAEATE